MNSALVPEYWNAKKNKLRSKKVEVYESQLAYQARQTAWIAILHINRRRVVQGIVGTLGNAQADANHIFRARQVSQVSLRWGRKVKR